MLQKPEISAGLMDHFAHMLTFFYRAVTNPYDSPSVMWKVHVRDGISKEITSHAHYLLQGLVFGECENTIA